MSIRFSADEILEMAQAIERNGAAFYQRAAEKGARRDSREALLKLAGMEAEHERVFAQMREGLSEEERRPVVYDPLGQAGLYLRAMADRQVFDVNADPGDRLSGQETMEEVLGLAIQAEKDSIVFYVGLKELVPARLGRDKVDRVIAEEMGHLSTLSEMLREELV